jgi:hypothetical protein
MYLFTVGPMASRIRIGTETQTPQSAVEEGILLSGNMTEVCCIIGIRHSISLLLGSGKRFLHHWGPTKDFVTIGFELHFPQGAVDKGVAFLESDRGFPYYWGLTKDFFITGGRVGMSMLLVGTV